MVDDIRSPESDKESTGAEPVGKTNEPNFTPPEVIAQEEEVVDMADPVDTKDSSTKLKREKQRPGGAKSKSPLASLKSWWRGLSKKQKIIIAVVTVLLLVALGTVAKALLTDKPAPVSAPVAKEEAKVEPPKTTEPSKLTGVEVPLEVNQRPVIGVMIENSPDARPQSGLHEAGVVFEAVAEGGITRFLTLFQDKHPDYVGPIRSVRPYYLSWLQGFDAPVAHVGGSAEALAKIRNDGIKDLDQSFNSGSYQRVSNRYAPHNVYTSLSKLYDLSKSKGFTSSSFTSLQRKAEAPAATPTAKKINIAISGPLYDVQFDYEAASNSYLRSLAGKPHQDERSSIQIKPKVVVAMVMNKGVAPDHIHTTYATTGSGSAFIFQDGTMTAVTWTKSSDKDQYHFTDANGNSVGLNPGQTWFTVVGQASSVTHSP